MTWRVFSSKMYPGEWRQKSKLLLDVLINHLWSRDPSDVPWEAILEGSRGMVWYFVNHWDANSTAVIRKCKGLGQRVPEGSCEAPELILLPWMWGQWASATVAHGTVLAELVTSHPHSKLKMISQMKGRLKWLEECFSIHFIQGTCELQSIVKLKQKKDTKMLRGVRPIERLMVEEIWLRKEKEREEIPLSIPS